jgi:hypothetical protein
MPHALAPLALLALWFTACAHADAATAVSAGCHCKLTCSLMGWHLVQANRHSTCSFVMFAAQQPNRQYCGCRACALQEAEHHATQPRGTCTGGSFCPSTAGVSVRMRGLTQSDACLRLGVRGVACVR